MAQDRETASVAEAAAPGDASAGRLASGDTLGGGRYIIERLTRESPFAEIYLATDSEANAPVSVHLVHEKLASVSVVVEVMAAAAEAAMTLDHKNLVRLLAFEREDGATYAVTEYVEGNALRELLSRKQATGGIGFGPRGANNILGGVCSALDEAHDALAHGALSADTVYVNKAGRVKVSDFALAAALPAAVRAGVLAAPPGMAPEVAKTGKPTSAGDVFSLGMLLYHVLTGRELVKGGPRPSEVENVGKDVDEVVARCAAPQPAKRPKTPRAMRAALIKALKKRSGKEDAAAPSQERAARDARATPPPGEADGRPSLAQAIVAPKSEEEEAPNFEELTNTEEKYLISKGKLDYGPFSLASIVEDIKSNQVLPGHIIIDKDTGARVSVEDHPLLAQLVDEAKQRRDDARRAQAEEQHSQQEARRGFALYAFIGAGVLAVGLAAFLIYKGLQSSTFSPKVEVIGEPGNTSWEYQIVVVSKEGRQGDLSKLALIDNGAAKLHAKAFNRVSWPSIGGAQQYLVYRTRAGGEPDSIGLIATVGADTLQLDDTGLAGDGTIPETRVAALEEGTLEAKITFPKVKKRRGKRRGRRRHRPSGGGDGVPDEGGGFDFMSEGGEEILDQSQINPVIQSRARRLGKCLLSKGASRADIEFKILRTGRVSTVNVQGANAEATACIKRVVKSMKFPAFDGNYTLAQFDMSL